MDIEELNEYYNKFKYGEDIFHILMQQRVQEILLVSTFYDAFIFEQDGRLAEQIFGEYHQLNLSAAPRITSVPTGEAALRKIAETKFDLVITTMRIGELTPFELSQRIKQIHPELPVLLLLNLQSDLALLDKNSKHLRHIDNVFLWNGDSQIFLAMIKYIEDRLNVAHDTTVGLVRVVLLVEDSIYFYSRFLPLLLKEMILQTQLLISEELNEMQRNYRMRTRPKVLLAHTFEEAIALCEQYREYLLCVITDVRFPQQGVHDAAAGLNLIHYLQTRNYDIPILLQSSEAEFAQTAAARHVHFLNKHSTSLLTDLSQFVHTHLGFGEFVFRDAEGREIERVKSLLEFERKLVTIPDEILIAHARRNRFSTWLLARGEIQVAKYLRPIQLEDFGGSVVKLREHLIGVFKEVRLRRNRGHIIDFDPQNLNEEHEIVRLSEGSLGGKGRGLAFLNALLATMDFETRFREVHVKIPRTAFIGTGEFDRFLQQNDLRAQIPGLTDEGLQRLFLEARLSAELREKLTLYVARMTKPLAVRSSGSLEDSQAQTFAGVYQTFMLPNNHPDPQVRQKQLEDAIKLVYASAFLQDARNYVEHIQYRLEEEKMAVILQEIAGQAYDDRYYPHFAGVAQSYNYYPIKQLQHHDGITSVALGLGHWVVGGENVFRFCPKYPQFQFLTAEELLNNSQTAFYALSLKSDEFDLTQGSLATLTRLELQAAETDGALGPLASVWDLADQRLRDGLSSRGPRVLTFAQMLKHKRFPLAAILCELLDIGEKALGVPVEIEFAVTLPRPPLSPRIRGEERLPGTGFADHVSPKATNSPPGRGRGGLLGERQTLSAKNPPLPLPGGESGGFAAKNPYLSGEERRGGGMDEDVEQPRPTFSILQIRPFYVYTEGIAMRPEEISKAQLLLYTAHGMGNGEITTIYDLIYLDSQKFDNMQTLKMQQELQTLNAQMMAENREYILIGPGRWGSRDRFLGIPVKWVDIHQARVIVEVGVAGFAADASQGTHFFHNLVTMNAGYFTVPAQAAENFIDWPWLRAQQPFAETAYFTHLRRSTPFIVKMFGKHGVAVIYK